MIVNVLHIIHTSYPFLYPHPYRGDEFDHSALFSRVYCLGNQVHFATHRDLGQERKIQYINTEQSRCGISQVSLFSGDASGKIIILFTITTSPIRDKRRCRRNEVKEYTRVSKRVYGPISIMASVHVPLAFLPPPLAWKTYCPGLPDGFDTGVSPEL